MVAKKPVIILEGAHLDGTTGAALVLQGILSRQEYAVARD
jgi:hypothetical protein